MSASFRQSLTNSRLLRWSLVGIAVFLALHILAALAGTQLPAEHSSERAIRLHRPIDEVWNALTDPRTQPLWRKDIREIEVLPDRGGLTVWRERYRNGRSLILLNTRMERPSLLVRSVADPRAPFHGEWIYRLEPTPSGTRLSIRETAVIENPFFRFVARFVLGHARATEKYLKFLGERFGEPVELEAVN